MATFATSVVLVVLGIVVFTVALVIVVAVLTRRAQRRLRDRFARFAADQGWQFIEKDVSYVRRWRGEPFTGGGTARNIVLGQYRQRNFCSFQYGYTTTTGRTTRTVWYGVVVLALPAPVPPFSVGREGAFGGKIAEALGFDRVNTGDEGFDNLFKVKSDNPQFAHFLLQQPALMQMLRATGPWNWRFSGQDMISYFSGQFEPAALTPRLDLMCDVLDRIPANVWTPSRR